ncbi:MAG: hypothetical protein ACREJB_05120, partial [Planctomycetaceae bacterium]
MEQSPSESAIVTQDEPAAERTAPATETVAALDRLDERVRACRGRSAVNPVEAAEELVRIEQELNSLTVGEETAESTGAGTALPADLHHWRRLCRQLGLEETVAETGRLTRQFLRQSAAAWQASVERLVEQSPHARLCFDCLMHTTVLHLETLREAEGRPSGQAVLAEVRDRLRSALRDAVEAEPPDFEIRQAWARDLLDRADMVLTTLDDVPPDCAAAQLQLLIDDLDWHLEHVERDRSRAARHLRRKLGQVRSEWQERTLQD